MRPACAQHPTDADVFLDGIHSQRQRPARQLFRCRTSPAIADDPHYTAPPPLPEPERLAIGRLSSRWSEKLTRRRDRASDRMARALNRVGYEATMRRIDRGGV